MPQSDNLVLTGRPMISLIVAVHECALDAAKCFKSMLQGFADIMRFFEWRFRRENNVDLDKDFDTDVVGSDLEVAINGCEISSSRGALIHPPPSYRVHLSDARREMSNKVGELCEKRRRCRLARE